MTYGLPLLVFTDLDGTLIDHTTYRWSAASAALAELKRHGCGLVLASSKTGAEIAQLRAELGTEEFPAIVENGAGLLAPFADADTDASAYDRLREVLAQMPRELRSSYTGFGDLSVQQVATLTGLPVDQARLAKIRAFSEPGTWTGTDTDKDAFITHLHDAGVIAQEGGRFLTLSFGGNKADRIGELVARYNPQTTVALGDAPNDVAMLQATDIGVIVANPHRAPLPELPGEADGRIIRTKAVGPEGWNVAILDLLDDLKIRKA